jgi:hypothetical protein
MHGTGFTARSLIVALFHQGVDIIALNGTATGLLMSVGIGSTCSARKSYGSSSAVLPMRPSLNRPQQPLHPLLHPTLHRQPPHPPPPLPPIRSSPLHQPPALPTHRDLDLRLHRLQYVALVLRRNQRHLDLCAICDRVHSSRHYCLQPPCRQQPRLLTPPLPRRVHASALQLRRRVLACGEALSPLSIRLERGGVSRHPGLGPRT